MTRHPRYRQNTPACLALLLLLSKFQGSAQALECASGWGKTKQVIPEDWINDGYCDCPLDGADEPETAACSGSSLWPGIPTADASVEDDGSSSAVFQCPEQPNLKLPFSQVHDGLCDCCDGADEPDGVCEDICEEVLRAEREARAALERDFAVGYEQRRQGLEAFAKLREEKLKEIEEFQAKMEQVTSEKDSLEGEIQDLTQKYMMERLLTMQKMVAGKGQELLAGLEISELKAVLVHACQLAGEQQNEDGSVCVALRLAGMDMGVTWDDDNFDDVKGINFTKKPTKSLANLLFDNAGSDSRNWKLDGKHKRRRLSEDDTNDYIPDDEYVEQDYDPYDGDDLYDDNNPKETKQNGQQYDGKQKELVEQVQASKLSATRMAFLERANSISEKISTLLDSLDKDDEETGDEESETKTEETASEDPPVDPAAYTMLRSSLGRKEETIHKGFQWGASALLFLEVADAADWKTQGRLVQLVLGTVYHGRLSAVQVWQILATVVSGLSSDDGAASPETCASPWASSCPPMSISRNGISIPNTLLLEAAASFCEHQSTLLMEGLCGVDDEEGSIPSIIPDGYHGYFKPIPRNDQDPLSTTLFIPLIRDALPHIESEKQTKDQLEENLQSKEEEETNLEREIGDTWKDIGGEDGTDLGPDGELHALGDSCFDVKAGKYTYEICLFGQAKQKEGDDSNGTGLGRWTDMERDDMTGERIWKWENGAKCWNGPHRSATAHVTCGTDTQVLSADEPDTCRYVLRVISPVACDEIFQRHMGL